MEKNYKDDLTYCLTLDSPDKSSCDVLAHDLDQLKEKHKVLKEVRAEVEELRSCVSEQYADEIGKDCITQ